MKTVQFLSNSIQVENIIRGLTLTKTLMVSSIIIGEPYIGKKSLIQSMFPKAVYIDATDIIQLKKTLSEQDEIVIYNFESIIDINSLNFENKRVIAIANHITNSAAIEDKFAFVYQMPSLAERKEDIPLLAKLFCKSIKQDLMLESDIEIEISDIDLSENIKSLKASIYRQLITADLDSSEIEKILFEYLIKRLDGNNAYREFLGLYERPLIKAGIQKYRSQLKLSSILGLNRNTLRKKIHEHHFD
jgi:DNA-binding protein Fis